MSDSLRPHGLPHATPPCPSPTPGACSNSCHWVGDAIQPSRPLSPPLLLPLIFLCPGLLHWPPNCSSNVHSCPLQTIFHTAARMNLIKSHSLMPQTFQCNVISLIKSRLSTLVEMGANKLTPGSSLASFPTTLHPWLPYNVQAGLALTVPCPLKVLPHILQSSLQVSLN